MWRFLSPANAVTLTGLWSAAASALLAASGRPDLAVVALVVSGICDLLDGLVARRFPSREEVQRFGARLDSLADVCSFGMAPVVLLWSMGLRTPLELLALGALLTCAAWRLAWFDVYGLDTAGDRTRFVGLPTTYVALVLPLALSPALLWPGAARSIGLCCAVGLAAAMVSPVRVPKPRGVWYALFPAMAVVVVVVWSSFGQRIVASP